MTTYTAICVLQAWYIELRDAWSRIRDSVKPGEKGRDGEEG